MADSPPTTATATVNSSNQWKFESLETPTPDSLKDSREVSRPKPAKLLFLFSASNSVQPRGRNRSLGHTIIAHCSRKVSHHILCEKSDRRIQSLRRPEALGGDKREHQLFTARLLE